MSKVLIVCGGTGGHLTPGIAIAEELTGRGHTCFLVVSRKKVDSRLIQNYPSMEFIEAPGAPFSWKPLALLKFIWIQLYSFVFAFRLLRKKQPGLVMGFGGFLSAGIALPAYLFRIPFVLHEANRVVGRSNRILSRLAEKVFLPVGVQIQGISPERIQFAGLPLRKEFQHMSREQALGRLDIQPSGKLLVIFGGSQGASSLNRWAEEHYRLLAEKGVSVYCLTGLAKDCPGELVTETKGFGLVRSWFIPFSDSMPAVLSSADVVVSRAGAGSIGEIIRCRVPAILIPYPYARDDHQTANARFVQQKDAAVIVEESRLVQLLDEVTDLLFNDSLADKLRGNLGELDQPQEAKILADTLEDLMSAESTRQSGSPVMAGET